jgi:hypothetical protein
VTSASNEEPFSRFSCFSGIRHHVVAIEQDILLDGEMEIRNAPASEKSGGDKRHTLSLS